METEGFLNKERTKSSKLCVCSKWCKIALIVMAFIVFFIITFAVVIAICAAGPLHAQCKVTWCVIWFYRSPLRNKFRFYILGQQTVQHALIAENTASF